MKKISVETRIPSDYVLLIGSVESDGNPFAVLSDRKGRQQVDTVSGSGSADVFDQRGHLVRQYAATEHADHSWEITELIRLNHETVNETHIHE